MTIDLDKVSPEKIEKLISETIKLLTFEEYGKAIEASQDLARIFKAACPPGADRRQMSVSFGQLMEHILDEAGRNQRAHGHGGHDQVRKSFAIAWQKAKSRGKLITNITRNTTPH